MYELKKIGMLFTSKSVGTGPSSYAKRIYGAAISQRLRNTALDEDLCTVIISNFVFLRMRNISEKKTRREVKTNILRSITDLIENRAVHEIM